jgi:hypothetical protein
MPAVCIGTPNVYDGIFAIFLVWREFRAEVFKRSDRVAEGKQVVQQALEQMRPFCKYFLKSQVRFGVNDVHFLKQISDPYQASQR